jgi:pyruvate formate lyase activating enzyme
MKQESRGPHEAMLYRKAEEDSCDCFLCSHRCHIKPGKRGVCRVRENRAGTLYTLVYGKLIAAHVDPIEKKPLYHFLPGTSSFSIATVGCNFQCDFCQNWQISQAAHSTVSGVERLRAALSTAERAARESEIAGEFTTPEEVVATAKSHRCPSISYTYTEPTIYFEYAADCARLAKAEGIRNVFVTNGYQTPETIEKMAGLIDAANVDLKAFNDKFYRERCKARLEPVCRAIRLMHEAGIHVEVTTLLIPEFNDDEGELRRLAEFLAGVSVDIPWHVSRYHPDYQFDRAPVTPSETIFHALAMGRKAGLKYLYAGNIAGDDFENTRCPNCKALLIRRAGFSAQAVGLSGSKCKQCGIPLPIVI